MRQPRSGFVAHIVSNHCAIHKYALACVTLPLELKSVLDSVVKAMNFIRGRDVNSRQFKAFCDHLMKEHQYFLFHTEVRWLSRGKVHSRVTELVTKVAVFLREHESEERTTSAVPKLWARPIWWVVGVISVGRESHSKFKLLHALS